MSICDLHATKNWITPLIINVFCFWFIHSLGNIHNGHVECAITNGYFWKNWILLSMLYAAKDILYLKSSKSSKIEWVRVFQKLNRCIFLTLGSWADFACFFSRYTGHRQIFLVTIEILAKFYPIYMSRTFF